MNQLIYKLTLRGIQLQLEQNNLGYCFGLEFYGESHIFIYSTLDESLDMMEYVVNLLEFNFR